MRKRRAAPSFLIPLGGLSADEEQSLRTVLHLAKSPGLQARTRPARRTTQGVGLGALSVSQVLPGPNIVNLALMFGDRYLGWRGATAALAGMLLAPLVIVLLLAMLYAKFAVLPVVAGALRGMGAVAAGLVITTGFKLSVTLRHNPMGLRACALFTAFAFLAIALLRWPLVWVLLGVGSTAIAVAWHRLGPVVRAPR